jgi:UDPglucose 6-dehydrogenase
LIKYASNAFLAVKISYINQMADLCEAVGADVHDVAKGMGLDKRIGAKFLHPGPGYGGSCFPKDTRALVKTAEDHHQTMSIVESAMAYNEARKTAMAQRVIAAMGGEVGGRRIAILGLAFKPETDDMRDSPSLDIIPSLLASGAEVVAYDPKSMGEAKVRLPKAVKYEQSALACIADADAVVVITEWNEFRALSAEQFVDSMSGTTMIDLRNLYQPDKMLAAGISYFSIGR